MRNKALNSGERQHAPDLERIEESHKQRYLEACKYIKPTDTVADLGCGVGYGTKLMSIVAGQVRGVDDSPEAIEFAKQHYSADNIIYTVVDLNICLSNMHIGICDVAVAFEIIEHLLHDGVTFEILRTTGAKLIILSTPHLKCPIAGNKFHQRHYGMDELIDRFWNIGYKPRRAELIYYGASLCNFMVMERR